MSLTDRLTWLSQRAGARKGAALLCDDKFETFVAQVPAPFFENCPANCTLMYLFAAHGSARQAELQTHWAKAGLFGGLNHHQMTLSPGQQLRCGFLTLHFANDLTQLAEPRPVRWE